ncbi:DNA-3-methyladenine glycosylase family protein [Niveispirillum sp. KHB5.9]|uniref:DNA-3-methyladenine glycosylase family protein n=1 Tax=Niveispirillum sp. KHB5.9 TaxID=3400269 RepID=UPI003A87932B
MASLPDIKLPAGYRADWVLSYHGRDPDGLSERVVDRTITKLLAPAGRAIRLDITLHDTHAALTADPGDVTDFEAARLQAAASRMLGVSGDVSGLEALAEDDPGVARLLSRCGPGLRLAQTASVFEAMCWAIVGQQVNLRFAGQLRRTLIELAGIDHPSGMKAHPTPAGIAALDPGLLGTLKFSCSKAAYLINAASAGVDFEALPEGDAATAEAAMTGIKGIGPWTRAYVLLRACAFPDVAPIGDAGLAAALQHFHGLDRRPTIAEQEALMRPFAPWRSLATAHLWAGWT